MVDIREGYRFGRGDFAITKGGERLTIQRIDYRGTEGSVSSCTVHTTDGRSLNYLDIGRYEKAPTEEN